MLIESLVLGDCLELLIDNRGKNPPYADSGVPAISGRTVRPGVLDLCEPKFVSFETWKSWMPNPTQRHDVIMTSEAPLGRAALIKTDEPMLVAQRVFGLRGRIGVLDTRFLYYALQTKTVQTDLASRATGSTVLGIRQPELLKVRIPAPDYERQIAIAATLGALDDKIASNELAIKLTSELLDAESRKALRDPVHSDGHVALGSIVDIIKGVSYRSADLADSDTALVTLKSIARNGDFVERGYKEYVGVYRSQQEVRRGDIVVAQTDITQGGEVIGTAVRVPKLKRYEAVVASLDLAIVRPKGNMPSEYLLALMRTSKFRNHCKAHSSGTTVLHLGRGALESYKVPVPDGSIVASYAQIARVYHNSIDSLTAEIDRLARIRDELLPLLMSGRLTVKAAESIVEEVV